MSRMPHLNSDAMKVTEQSDDILHPGVVVLGDSQLQDGLPYILLAGIPPLPTATTAAQSE